MRKDGVSVKEVLLLVFAVVPFVAMMYSHHALQENCIVWVGVAGDCHYGARYMLWLLSLMPVMFAGGVTAYLNTGKRNERQNDEVKGIALAVIIFMLGYMAALLVRNFNVEIIDIYNLVCFSVSILFATLGNSLLRKDSLLKMKNLWIVSNERVAKTVNKLAGYMCIIGGFIQASSSVVFKRLHLFYVMISVFVACLMVPNIMSYIWNKKNIK